MWIKKWAVRGDLAWHLSWACGRVYSDRSDVDPSPAYVHAFAFVPACGTRLEAPIIILPPRARPVFQRTPTCHLATHRSRIDRSMDRDIYLV